MARVPYLNPSDLAPENRDLLARNVNPYRALTHSPDATRSRACPTRLTTSSSKASTANGSSIC